VLDLASGMDETTTARVRAANDAEYAADSLPLQDDASLDRAERDEFAATVQMPESRESRKPRKR
jgi:hypothetical protein